MKRNVVAVVVLVLLFLGLAEQSVSAAATEITKFPIKPVTVIVTAGVGGGTDITARLISSYWEKSLGKPVFVTNKPGGAGGMLAMRELKNSPPDGYTVACYYYPDSPVTSYLKGAQAGFSMDDFVTIGSYAAIPGAVMVNGKNFKTLKEFIAAAKKEPGKLSISFVGDAWKLHIIELEKALGIKLNAVNFKSGGEGHNALLGGHVQAQMAVTSFAWTSKDLGIIPLVMMGGNQRLESFPDTPTMKELGYDVDYDVLFPFVVHKSTPKPVLDKLISSFKEVGKNADFVSKLKGAGFNNKPMFGADIDNDLKVKNIRVKEVVEQNKDKFGD
jgi:tripartite-type tricarboxylate transporter receptor subunit TctC